MCCLKFLLNLINVIIIEMKILLYMTLSNYKIQIKIMNLKFIKKLK